MNIELRALDSIRPYENNPRLNDPAVDAVAASIAAFGFRQPIVVDAGVPTAVLARAVKVERSVAKVARWYKVAGMRNIARHRLNCACLYRRD